MPLQTAVRKGRRFAPGRRFAGFAGEPSSPAFVGGCRTDRRSLLRAITAMAKPAGPVGPAGGVIGATEFPLLPWRRRPLPIRRLSRSAESGAGDFVPVQGEKHDRRYSDGEFEDGDGDQHE